MVDKPLILFETSQTTNIRTKTLLYRYHLKVNKNISHIITDKLESSNIQRTYQNRYATPNKEGLPHTNLKVSGIV